ncbi:cytochrome C biogenesis protein CcdA [Iodidimonas nitroreducens]|uniref:Cytochrome C biogenesis protein CcdA n=1 Tax=Iodidimonas nitroreducens TaxID=1236968 RepID=A0A5A7N5B9_9PROT|nr:cytochrome c biogenesis CcdA family protein [Iodidimonas nitroreducens]GAK33022.1 putative cytochrome c-type biogenesis protein [alpha proteobacterium Q-1]GER03471.1 cytochrome C biogenesis protein CcdA [Iodidimonas nitroreducens]
MGSAALAYLAGLVTILNPCVLPILPILVGSSLSQSRYGPAALAAGLVFSFSTFGLLILAFGFSIGLDQELLRMGAGVLLVAAGLLFLLSRAQMAFVTATGPLVSGGNRMLDRISGDGLAGQFSIGALLGLVWAPCVGPTLGVAIAAASRGENLAGAFGIFLVFGLGVATSILAFAYGSRKALAGRKQRLQALARYAKPIFGMALLFVGVLILSGIDRMIESAMLDIMPQWLIEFTTQF